MAFLQSCAPGGGGFGSQPKMKDVHYVMDAHVQYSTLYQKRSICFCCGFCCCNVRYCGESVGMCLMYWSCLLLQEVGLE